MHRRILWLAAMLALGACGAAASDFDIITDGGFELPLEEAWSPSISGDFLYIDHNTILDHDPDYEVRLWTNDGHGNAKILQRVILPSLDTVFSATLKSSAIDGNGAWCAAGLMISYKGVHSEPLGKTFLGSRSAECPWADADDFHCIDLGAEWSEYGFIVGDELANLPAVNPSEVFELEVMLIVSAANC